MGKIEKHGTRNLRRFSFSFSRFLSFSSFACAISVYLVFWTFSVQISIHKLPMALVVCVVCCSPCIKVALLHSFFHFAFMLEFFFSLLLCVFLPSHPRAPVCFYLFLNLCTIRNATTCIGSGVCMCQFEPRSASILRHHFLMDFLWLFCYKCNQVSCTSECHWWRSLMQNLLFQEFFITSTIFFSNFIFFWRSLFF